MNLEEMLDGIREQGLWGHLSIRPDSFVLNITNPEKPGARYKGTGKTAKEAIINCFKSVKTHLEKEETKS